MTKTKSLNCIAILMPGDRAMFESGDIYGTAEERQRGAENFVAYAGRYEQRGGTVFHYPDASYFPNWVGQELSRTVDLDGDRMTLATKPEKAGGGESADAGADGRRGDDGTRARRRRETRAGGDRAGGHRRGVSSDATLGE